MAVQLDPSVKDDKNEIKTHFVTREGVYRILNFSSEEFVRPRAPGVGYQSNQSSPQVRLSFVSIPGSQHATSPTPVAASATNNCVATGSSSGVGGGGGGIGRDDDCHNLSSTTNSLQQTTNNSCNAYGHDRICFNIGKELHICSFKGIRKPADVSKSIDKKMYKGTNPSCHDFNATIATAEGAPLLVGFTTGQIQLMYPGKRDQGKLYNEDRLIDKTKVTCLKWVPGSATLFLAAHASGNMYLYNEEFPPPAVAPSYQPYKCGDGYAVMMSKSKSVKNPLYKWTFGSESYSINEVCFSPCGTNLAIVSQDGFLRVFQYRTMDLIGFARSYFGGLLCVCWSPDGKYIVVGGEDDLVTVFSMQEKRVVARGQGHRSWVSVVAFDPFTTNYTSWDGPDFSDDENPINESYHRYINHHHESHKEERSKKTSSTSARDSLAPDKLASSYRLGSVGQDTQLCLWDITEDVLRQMSHRPRLSSHEPLTNGSSVDDNVPTIKPMSSSSATTQLQHRDQVDASCLPSKGLISAKLMANCTNLESSDSKELISGDNSSKFINSTTTSKSNSLVGNCIGNNVNVSKDSLTNDNKSTTDSTLSSRHSSKGGPPINGEDATNNDSTTTLTPITTGNNANNNHSSSAFNTLTQKFSNFSFGSDKNNGAGKTHKKRNFTLSKSSEKQLLNHINGNNNQEPTTTTTTTINNLPGTSTNSLTKSNKSLSSSTTTSGGLGGVICTIDPIKLIGSPACPRFEETPVLEPLVCKKIAHERLTALVFREDCFITACQDGLIYTWARPGFGYQQSIQHNLPSSPSTMPGGTVV